MLPRLRRCAHRALFKHDGGCVMMNSSMLATSTKLVITLLYAVSAGLLASELWRASSYSRAGKWRRLSPAMRAGYRALAAK